MILFGGVFVVSYFNKDYWDFDGCINECIHRGYKTGNCLWPFEAEEGNIDNENFLDIGSCVIEQSKHCGNKGQCNCYCENNSLINGDNMSEEDNKTDDFLLCIELGCSKDTIYVGSINSDKYYGCDCHYALRIKPENIVCFEDDQDALSSGYVKSEC